MKKFADMRFIWVTFQMKPLPILSRWNKVLQQVFQTLMGTSILMPFISARIPVPLWLSRCLTFGLTAKVPTSLRLNS